ncbi:transposase [Zoogloea sp. LCSB751]|uniref:transposase n=1 Tax=Zoogloea sp. LCSB751 TaxID=1965277 RepID=UPI0013747918|nr:transposase [Zoogloea sp. LCSB751]
MYARYGRPAIPLERLLKAKLLIVFYSANSDRQFSEQLDCNLLFHWLLDQGLESGGPNQSVFSRFRDCLVKTATSPGASSPRSRASLAGGKLLAMDEELKVRGLMRPSKSGANSLAIALELSL